MKPFSQPLFRGEIVMDYSARINAVRERIIHACERAGRHADEVKLVAVTKYIGVEETRALIRSGITDLAENRVQVALPKVKEIHENVCWHFIGHLQTNKVKDVLPYFQMIHSLDRLSLAKEIDLRAKKMGIETVSCLVQVNVSGEATKGGLKPDEVRPFLESLAEFSSIRIYGLMTMAPRVEIPEETRSVFRRLKELRDSLQYIDLPYVEMRELSMGMSEDFEVAIEEGATMVRLGSILVKP
jgi:PLP dependent protein